MFVKYYLPLFVSYWFRSVNALNRIKEIERQRLTHSELTVSAKMPKINILKYNILMIQTTELCCRNKTYEVQSNPKGY